MKPRAYNYFVCAYSGHEDSDNTLNMSGVIFIYRNNCDLTGNQYGN
jgi:hypothetical protein